MAQAAGDAQDETGQPILRAQYQQLVVKTRHANHLISSQAAQRIFRDLLRRHPQFGRDAAFLEAGHGRGGVEFGVGETGAQRLHADALKVFMYALDAA